MTKFGPHVLTVSVTLVVASFPGFYASEFSKVSLKQFVPRLSCANTDIFLEIWYLDTGPSPSSPPFAVSSKKKNRLTLH